tara:strand:+ start:1038 stop:1415 length:378 start_codon:yes stop_codon:yes gene_type:complete
MDAKTKIIIGSVQEFLETAKDAEKKNRLKSSVTMYFKAIVEACDFFIYSKILKVPDNHKDRFEHLKKFDYELNEEVHNLFNIYRKTYSQKVDVADLVIIKNGTEKILKKLGIYKTLNQMAEEKRD